MSKVSGHLFKQSHISYLVAGVFVYWAPDVKDELSSITTEEYLLPPHWMLNSGLWKNQAFKEEANERRKLVKPRKPKK